MIEDQCDDIIERHRMESIRRDDARRRIEQREAFMARVPRKFREKTFQDFEVRNDSGQAALDATKQFVAGVIAKEAPMLALIGTAGLGKSMLLYIAAQVLFQHAMDEILPEPQLIRWWRFTDELRYGRGARDERDRPAESAYDVRTRWHDNKAPCMIDEFRFTSSTDHDATEMAKYALTAYDDEIPVMLTGNNGKLVDIMGDAPADRFSVVTLSGESYR